MVPELVEGDRLEHSLHAASSRTKRVAWNAGRPFYFPFGKLRALLTFLNKIIQYYLYGHLIIKATECHLYVTREKLVVIHSPLDYLDTGL